MGFVQLSTRAGIAEVTFARGKVNALNEQAVQELRECFENLAEQSEVKAIILTGQGTKFFSFGFDIPEFLSYSKEAFAKYLEKFTGLYTYLFTYPKPLIAALNGHTIAGGCMLALACDYRVMVSGKAKISLNEITFGSSLFAGSLRMLKFVVGERNAQAAAYSGAMYTAEEAQELGLVDQVSADEQLMEHAREAASHFAAKYSTAFRSIKRLLRSPAAKEIAENEESAVREFVDIWYSESTWKNLQTIKIHS
jgi:3,2-trans-enoyl-CoA isomerase